MTKPIQSNFRHINLDNCIPAYDCHGTIDYSDNDLYFILSNSKKPSKYGVVTFCYKFVRVNQIPNLYNLHVQFALCSPKDEFNKKIGCYIAQEHFNSVNDRYVFQVQLECEDDLNNQMIVDSFLLNSFMKIITNELEIFPNRMNSWIKLMEGSENGK